MSFCTGSRTMRPQRRWSARVASREISGIVSAHGVTAVYYLAQKQADRMTAEGAVDHLIRHFHIASLDKTGWQRARSLPFTDFEDAVIASVAEGSGCDYIITRNTAHFTGSLAAALTPADFLCLLTPPA